MGQSRVRKQEKTDVFSRFFIRRWLHWQGRLCFLIIPAGDCSRQVWAQTLLVWGQHVKMDQVIANQFVTGQNTLRGRTAEPAGRAKRSALVHFGSGSRQNQRGLGTAGMADCACTRPANV